MNIRCEGLANGEALSWPFVRLCGEIEDMEFAAGT